MDLRYGLLLNGPDMRDEFDLRLNLPPPVYRRQQVFEIKAGIEPEA